MKRRDFIRKLGGYATAFEAIRLFSGRDLLPILQGQTLPGWQPYPELDFSLNATPTKFIDLSGQWHLAIDPENVGKSASWFDRAPVESAVTANVPGPLQLTFPFYNGVIWYWKDFDPHDLANHDDVRIHFQGADYYAEAWLNGEYLGGNESALLPFAFSAKRALRSGTNRLVVRVIDACDAKEIDGFQLGHVPGGRQADNPLRDGWHHYNYGGLVLPVSFQAFQRPWIADGFIQPDIKGGKIEIDLLFAGNESRSEWDAVITPLYPRKGRPVVREKLSITPDSNGKAQVSLRISHPHLWKIWDSFLYEVLLSPKGKGTAWKQRFGMREVSILDGRIAVNGEPILQRSFLYNQIWPVTLGVPYKDMARRDAELVRQANANMLRCFSKSPVPATVDAADEVGILLQPESLGSWYLQRGEKEQSRLKNITERNVLLYHNHPSILWWNILNENSPLENPGNPMLLGPYALQEILPRLHELDSSRPAICNDPIWHDVPNIWQPGHSKPSLPLIQDHYYPFTALVNHEDSWAKIRGRAWGEKPTSDTPFLAVTEWGQNSSPQWNKLIESYKTSGVREDSEDYWVYRKLRAMNQGWYERSGIQRHGFPTLESVEDANRESVAQRYREQFALFWGNVHSVGQGMTSLEDSSYELSGVVDNWRNPKPVVFDVLHELNRPLQINLWLRPSSIYSNDRVTFDATLVNEGHRLPPGEYSLSLKLVDSQKRVAMQKEYRHRVAGNPIEFLMVESVLLKADPGIYHLALELQGNNTRLTAQQPVQVFERKTEKLGLNSTVWIWEKGDKLQRWLEKRGVIAHKGNASKIREKDLMLILEADEGVQAIDALQAAIQEGGRAIILEPEKVLAAPTKASGFSQSYSQLLRPISGQWKPELREISWWGSPGAWGYSRAALALQHPFLEGLPQAVALEAQPAYQQIAPKYTWAMDGQPELVQVDEAIVESSLNVDAPYTTDLCTVSWEKGTLVLNTLHLGKNLGSDPAADRILENILRHLEE